MYMLVHPIRLVALTSIILLTSIALPNAQNPLAAMPFQDVTLAADAVTSDPLSSYDVRSAKGHLRPLAGPLYPVTIQTTITPTFIDAGQPITISFVIMPASVQIQWPSGVVTVYGINAEPICIVMVQSAGSCTFTPAARGTIIIDYSGDTYFAPSQVRVVIPMRIRTTLLVNALPNPVGAGQIITLTAGLTSNGIACAAAFFCAPTGQVQYDDNGISIGIAGVHPRVGAVFPLMVTLMLVGTHHITGYYSGDSLYTPSASTPLTIEVIPLQAYLPLIVQPYPTWLMCSSSPTCGSRACAKSF